MADPTLSSRLKSIPEVLHTGTEAKKNAKDSRSINIPGKGETKVSVPWVEGYYGEGKTVHDRLVKSMDSFVKDESYAGDDKAMKYKLEDEIVTNDVKRAYSNKNTELFLVIEDDNNDGVVFCSGMMCSTVGNGVRLNIGDSGELTAEILKDHRIDNTWFLGHKDGRHEDEAIIEDLMVRNNSQLVFDSTAGEKEAGGSKAGEQFMRDVIKYFGQHLGARHDYALEWDATFNPVVQKGMLTFMQNYFTTLDYHIKNDRNKKPFIENLEKMLPLLVEELSYASDNVKPHDGNESRNDVSARTIMKASLGLEDGDNLITGLAGYYGLNEEISGKTPEEKLASLEKVFSKVRDLVDSASDYDFVREDYKSAFAKAVKDTLGLDMSVSEIEGQLGKYISTRIDALDENEIKNFLKDIQFSEEKKTKEEAPAAIEVTAKKEPEAPKAAWYKAVELYSKANDKSPDQKFIAELIMEKHDEINKFLTAYGDKDSATKQKIILSMLKKTKLGKEVIKTPEMEKVANQVIDELLTGS